MKSSKTDVAVGIVATCLTASASVFMIRVTLACAARTMVKAVALIPTEIENG